MTMRVLSSFLVGTGNGAYTARSSSHLGAVHPQLIRQILWIPHKLVTGAAFPGGRLVSKSNHTKQKLIW